MRVLTYAQLRVHIFGLCQLVLLASAHLICDEYGLKAAQLRVHAKMCTRTYPPSPVLVMPSSIYTIFSRPIDLFGPVFVP